MVKKYYRDWKNFQESSSEFLSQNFHKSRVTLKYRNKLPSYGKLYLTNDNKSYYIKLAKRKDIDKIETYFKGVLYMMANKPIEVEKEEIQEKTEKEDNKIINKEGENEQPTKTETTETNKKKSNKNKNKKNKKGKK